MGCNASHKAEIPIFEGGKHACDQKNVAHMEAAVPACGQQNEIRFLEGGQNRNYGRERSLNFAKIFSINLFHHTIIKKKL